jgi:hypothetical protein
MPSKNDIGYRRPNNSGQIAPFSYDQMFQACEPNDNRAVGINIRLGDRKREVNIGLAGILGHLNAGYAPDKSVVKNHAKLLPEHIDQLKVAGIPIEPADDKGNYRTVEPLWIDGFYADRR